jgi:hypothetical protein
MIIGLWISYDLGVEGDYQGLYGWLDSKKALECGDSMAFMKMKLNSYESLIDDIKRELKESVSLKKGDRIYLICFDNKKIIRGRFILGKRKRSPWEGFSSEGETLEAQDLLE